MTPTEAKLLEEVFEALIKRIEELEAEVARMKREPRQSLAAKIRSKQ